MSAIAGPAEESIWFDERLRPASEQVRARWVRIALAHRRGVALPPVTLMHCPTGYYVLDGRHRISVARELGVQEIEAWVFKTVA